MCYLQVPEIKISMWAVTAAQEGVGKSCAVCGPQCRDGSVRAAQAQSSDGLLSCPLRRPSCPSTTSDAS